MMRKHKITVCIGSACFASGNARNVELIEKFLKAHNITDDVDIEISGGLCTGNCPDAPNVIVDDVAYHKVTAESLTQILEKVLLNPADKSEGKGGKKS